MDRKIIQNAIQTPDGTILISRHVHDFVNHIDTNGEEYFTDGGREYLRRSLNKVSFTDLTVYSDEPYKVIREKFEWGTYGKSGREPLQWIKLSQLSDEHIKNIIATQPLDNDGISFFHQELLYRKLSNITVDKTVNEEPLLNRILKKR